MDNIMQHFAKFLGERIVIEKTGEVVVLLAVGVDGIQYQRRGGETLHGKYKDFKLLLQTEDQMYEQNLPDELCVVEVERVIVNLPTTISPEYFLKKIKGIVYDIFDTNEDEMLSNTKKKDNRLAEARQIIMVAYFSAFYEHKRHKVSLSKAGKLYGKDHATVLHALKKINNLLDTSRKFRSDFSQVWELVKSVNPYSRLHI